jgi:hypothetical protein
MHNPDINSLHDLVKLLVGASAEVDVAIEQRVEEGTTVIAGFKPEEMSQIMRKFEQYSRWQKELDKSIGVLESECQTVRRETFEWTKMMERQEQEAITRGLNESRRKKAKEKEKKKKAGTTEDEKDNGDDEEGGENVDDFDSQRPSKKIEAGMIPLAKPGMVQMISMPSAMVPADLKAVAAAAKAGAKIALAEGEAKDDLEDNPAEDKDEGAEEDIPQDTKDRFS